jgi:hypothetical protein
MRRTIFLALLAALLLAPAAHAADPIAILRDCNDDSVLQGNYSPSELRQARKEIPTDADEYGDCRDVLSRAIAEASGSDSAGGSFGREPSGGTGTGDSGGDTGGDLGAGTSEGDTTPAPEPSATVAPSHSPEEDARLLNEAAASGERGVVVGGRAVSPGETQLAAQVGRNSVPATTVAVLALFVVALLVVLALPLIRRRRGVAPPQP